MYFIDCAALQKNGCTGCTGNINIIKLLFSVHKLVPEIPTPYIFYIIILIIILYTEKRHTRAHIFLFTFCCCSFTRISTVARMHHNEPDVSGSTWALIRFSIQVTRLLCYENKINGVN